MGEIHFHRKDSGAVGLTRDRSAGTYRLLEDLAQLRDITTRKRDRHDPPWLVELLHDLERATLGGQLQSDRYLLDQLSWTNWERWLERVQAGRTQHRIAVRSWITTHGNLTVRFAPQYMDDALRWRHAPEWREMTYLGMAAIAERPDDEILFLHNVERVVVSERRPAVKYVSPEVLTLVCRVVNAVFWEVLERLSRSFEVFVQSYVVALGNGKKVSILEERDLIGVELVNADADLRADTSAAIEAFEADAGCSIATFAATWAEAEAAGKYPDDYVSRRLRNKEGPTKGLTPGLARGLHERLARAQKLGLWHPPPVSIVPPEQKHERPQTHRASISPRPAPKVVAFPRPRRTSAASIYPIAHIELGEEERARFGVSTAAELVTLVNEALVRAGRRQLAQGDMPTSHNNLKRLLTLATGLVPAP